MSTLTHQLKVKAKGKMMAPVPAEKAAGVGDRARPVRAVGAAEEEAEAGVAAASTAEAFAAER